MDKKVSHSPARLKWSCRTVAVFYFWGLKPHFLQLYNGTAFAAIVVDFVLGGDADG